MFTAGKSTINRIKLVLVAAILIVATFCVNKSCYALDDEAMFTRVDRDEVVLPDDLSWEEKGITITDKDGREIKYILRDKMVRVYIDDKLVWHSNSRYFVQDMFVADIDPDTKNRDARIVNKSDEELVLLLWKEGRYGNHRPFWVLEDEKEYSQHLFTYNIEGNSLRSKWGSSYMGDMATSMKYENGILFLSHEDEISKGNSKKESAWKWISFGFEKIEPVKILVAGDNLMHNPIYEDALNNHNGDFEYLYKKIEKNIQNADLSIINLETPLVYDPAKYSTYPCFGSPVGVAKGIKDAGFDVVTLSTNHRFDKGVTGIKDTIAAVEENELLHVGSMDEKPYLLIKRNNIVFSLLNYTYGTNGIRPPKGYEKGVNYLEDEERIRKDIREAKENSDFVIVFPHWGTEYRTTIDSYQEKWRKIFYEEGVDAVVGTHPHVYQEYELYTDGNSEKEMLIYYSLGNYISANARPEHNSGGIGTFEVSLTMDGPKVTSYEFEPIDTMYKSSKYK